MRKRAGAILCPPQALVLQKHTHIHGHTHCGPKGFTP